MSHEINDIDQTCSDHSPTSQPRPHSEDRIERRFPIWTIKRIRESIGLDWMTMLKMLKAGLPPTIVIAMYQSSTISDITLTSGFISAIMAVASQCLLPRAKFMKVMFYNLLSVSISAALCCLGILSAVKAREHTTPLGGSLDDYNSSACAVCAVWLIFAIWTSNTLRAYKQQELQDPMVAFAIFASITLTQASQFSTISNGLTFVKQLLLSFLLGFVIATGVSLFILPITNRRNFLTGSQKYAVTIGDVTEAQKLYIKAYYAQCQAKDSGEETAKNNTESTARVLKSRMISLIAIHDRLHEDLVYAQNEIAWGKLAASDLQSVFSRLRSLLLPLAGLSMLPEIFSSLDNNIGWKSYPKEVDGPIVGNGRSRFLLPMMEEMNAAFDLATAGVQHALLILGIVRLKESNRRPQNSNNSEDVDVERAEEECVPGGVGFALHLEKNIREFTSRQQDRHKSAGNSISNADKRHVQNDIDGHEDLFVFLFTQHLLWSLLEATLDIVKFADGKLADGTMKCSHVVFPQKPCIQAWLGLGSGRKGTSDPIDGNDDLPGEIRGSVDPEHLPPTNAWEIFGNGLRYLSQILASDQSIFGFRAAIASFCIAILAFLKQSQDFFSRQRLIWVLIVLAFGMSPTSGAGLFSFAGRIGATTVSLVLSLIVWYIVDGHIVGVIVFLYIANVFEYYFYVKYPQYIGPCVIAIVTLNVILAYELQVDQLGIAVETATSGQPYYPVYLFGPYKLLAVIVGCTIGFIWTVFPYPITSRSQVRRLLGRGLFKLANFYSCMHTTIEVWIDGSRIDIQSSPHLLAEREKLFSDEMTLITAMRKSSEMAVYEPPIGGKFPKATYDNIISEIQSILISMALMAKIPESLSATATEQQEQEWLRRLAAVIESTDFNSHITTSLLCHLSAAVSTGTALPPQLSPPEPFPVARKLRTLNLSILDKKYTQDPAFAAFASLEVLSSIVNNRLANLISNVKSLVGEVKFDKYVKRPRQAQNATE